MGDIKTNFCHSFDHGRWWSRARDHTAHRPIDAGTPSVWRVIDLTVHDGCGAIVVDTVRADGCQNGLALDLSQAHMRARLHGNGPREAPTVAVEHRQRPQVRSEVGHGPRGDVAHGIKVSASVVGNHPFGVASCPAGVTYGDGIPLIGGAVQRSQWRVCGNKGFIRYLSDRLTRAGEFGVVHVNHHQVSSMHGFQYMECLFDGVRERAIGNEHLGLAMVHLPRDEGGV